MDAYPREYVAPNVPLIVLSGVDGQESPQHSIQTNGPRIGTDNIQIQSARGTSLIDAFLRLQDAHRSAETTSSKASRVSFKVARTVSRSSPGASSYWLICISNIRCPPEKQAPKPLLLITRTLILSPRLLRKYCIRHYRPYRKARPCILMGL